MPPPKIRLPWELRDLAFLPPTPKKKPRSLRGCHCVATPRSQERDLRFAWLVAHDAGRRIDHEPHLISLNVDAANAPPSQHSYNAFPRTPLSFLHRGKHIRDRRVLVQHDTSLLVSATYPECFDRSL